MVASVKQQKLSHLAPVEFSLRQSQVLGWKDIPRERLAMSIGSIRAGKTYISSLAFFLYTQFLDEPFLHLIGGRKARTVELEIIQTLRYFARVAGKPFRYKSNDQTLYIGEQTYAIACGNDKKSEDRLIGLTTHSSLLDEITLLPEDFFKTAVSRMSYPDSKAWGCANPQGPNNFIKKEWIDKNRVARIFDFGLDDNPTLSDEVKEYYIETFDGVFAQRLIQGLWAATSGLIWPDPLIERIPIFEYAPSAQCVIGVDYGISVSGTAIVPIVRIGKEHWHVPEVLLIQNSEDRPTPIDEELADAVWGIAKKYGGTRIVIDHAGGASLISLMQRQKGRKDKDGWLRKAAVYGANKEVQLGIRFTGSCLKTGKVTLGPGARELAEDIQSYVWDEQEENTPHKEGKNQFDLCDALRYGTMAALYGSVKGHAWKNFLGPDREQIDRKLSL